MRSIDSGLRRVDDDEHLGGEIRGLAVEDDARNLDLIEDAGIACSIEVQPRKPMLAVDDQETGFRVFEIADGLELTKRPELAVFLRQREECCREWRVVFRRTRKN